MPKLVYIAEVVGKTGMQVLKRSLPKIRSRYTPDIIIANTNSATGNGLGRRHAGYIRKLGVHCQTTGDGCFKKKDLTENLDDIGYVLRPLNISKKSPGRGFCFRNIGSGKTVAVVSLLGRSSRYRISGNDPFEAVEAVLRTLKTQAQFIVVDFFSRTTAEVQTMGFFLDGRVSAVIGSGARVATADERCLKKGTAFITGSGRTGSFNSVSGYDPQGKIDEYKSGLSNLSVDSVVRPVLQGVYIDFSVDGQVRRIDRIFMEDTWNGTGQ